jgi:hypothetical protein
MMPPPPLRRTAFVLRTMLPAPTGPMPLPGRHCLRRLVSLLAHRLLLPSRLRGVRRLTFLLTRRLLLLPRLTARRRRLGPGMS